MVGWTDGRACRVDVSTVPGGAVRSHHPHTYTHIHPNKQQQNPKQGGEDPVQRALRGVSADDYGAVARSGKLQVRVFVVYV